MAERQTTKQVAVWNPPRLHKIILSTIIQSGTKNVIPRFEGGANPPTSTGSPNAEYRMPNSGEVQDRPF